MTFKEIQELIKLVNKNKLSEFKLKDGDFEISIRTEKYTKSKAVTVSQPAQVLAPAQTPTPAPAPAAAPAPEKEKATKADEQEKKESNNYLEIKSPMVGTFYRSAAPDKPPYVKVGDTVEPDSVVCIIEAMKLFNEIEAEVSGKIVKVMVEDAQPVEFGQVLFLVEPA